MDPSADPTSQENLDRVTRTLGIPPCPAILAEFSATMQQADPDVRRLAALIASDIALSAALLKFVNSPFFGLRTKAGNVRHALTLIGLRAGANLVTGLILRRAFPSASGPLMQRFWDRAGGITAAALGIARRLKDISADDAHTYALFRDCGIPVMIGNFSDYGDVFDSLETHPGMQIINREQSRYGYSHARVGYALARGWLLPEPMCRAILHHHDFDKVATNRDDVDSSTRRLIAFGLLVEQVASLRAAEGLCADWTAGEAFVLDTLAISADQIIALASEPQNDRY